MEIIERLEPSGPMTAFEFGDVFDGTPANCSWQLCELAEYLLVEERRGRWVVGGQSTLEVFGELSRR